MIPESTVAQFYRSTEEALVFRYTFENRSFTGRTLRINIRDRETNLVKKTLNAPANLTIASTGAPYADYPDNDVTAFVALADMNGWRTGEYEVDLLDVTSAGAPTRIVAGRVTMHDPGKMVYGVVGNQATVKMEANQAVISAVGGVGIPGPATGFTVGTVTTLAPGEDATVEIEGDPPTLEISFGIPQGETGDKGWSPYFGLVEDGLRIVLMLAGWSGGEGDPPGTTTGGDPLYVGVDGFTTDIAEAVNVRGLKGDTGNDGAAATVTIGDVTTSLPGSDAEVTNVGTTLNAVLDFVIPRGEQGPPGSVVDGDKGDVVVTGGGTIWTVDGDTIDNAKLANMAAGRFKLRKAGSGTGDPIDATAAEATAELNVFGADTGSGGPKGLVPATVAGDATKSLMGDGTFKDTLAAVARDVLPDTTATRDLGSTAKTWAEAHVDNLFVTNLKNAAGTTTLPFADLLQGLARVWYNLNGTGTIALRDSLNISSITDLGTGNYRATHATAFAAATYSAKVTANSPMAYLTAQLAGSMDTTHLGAGGTAVDISIVCGGDHGDM